VPVACSRRQFFGEFGRTILADATNAVRTVRSELIERAFRREQGEVEAERERPRAWLRPPGALPEEAFRRTCTQCTDCQEACPYQSIRRLGPEFGENAGTPAVIPVESPCYLCPDMPCIAACQPQALVPTEPKAVLMGLAVVALDSCYLTQGQPCDYCITRCPLKQDAIGLNEAGLPEIRPDGCTGCGVCAYLCPADAIFIDPCDG